MSSEEAQILLEQNRQLKAELDLLRANQVRKGVAPLILWVNEQELAQYIPYSVRDIKKMRKEGKIRAYPDISGGKRVIYNLMEVSNKIQGSTGKPLRQFDPDAIKISL